MLELDHKEGCVSKDWFFWTVVLEKTPESPLDCKIKGVNPKGNEPWIFTVRTIIEAPILRSSDVKSRLIGKTLMLGKTKGKRRREQQRMRWLDNITEPMDVSLSEPWELVMDRDAWCAVIHGFAESDPTERLNWTELRSGLNLSTTLKVLQPSYSKETLPWCLRW